MFDNTIQTVDSAVVTAQNCQFQKIRLYRSGGDSAAAARLAEAAAVAACILKLKIRRIYLWIFIIILGIVVLLLVYNSLVGKTQQSKNSGVRLMSA
jgi:hypothetical protein